MTEPPHTYAEWARLIERFRLREDRDEVLDAMRAGTLEWQTGVAERFTGRLLDAANSRLNSAADRFQRDLSRSAGRKAPFL